MGGAGRAEAMAYRKAWNEGLAAGMAGRDPRECPYRTMTPEALAWFSGYIEGKAARAARRR